MARLKILNESNDGFYISSQDLKLRGPGELFGIRQSEPEPLRIFHHHDRGIGNVDADFNDRRRNQHLS